MPSPTSRTRPTSRVSSWVRYCSISRCRTETISSALNLMTAHLPELFAQIEDLGTHRAVEDEVADPQDHAAQELRLDLLVDDRLQAEGAAQVGQQPLGLLDGEGHGGAHLDAEAPPPEVVQDLHFF